MFCSCILWTHCESCATRLAVHNLFSPYNRCTACTARENIAQLACRDQHDWLSPIIPTVVVKSLPEDVKKVRGNQRHYVQFRLWLLWPVNVRLPIVVAGTSCWQIVGEPLSQHSFSVALVRCSVVIVCWVVELVFCSAVNYPRWKSPCMLAVLWARSHSCKLCNLPRGLGLGFSPSGQAARLYGHSCPIGIYS